MFQTGVSWESIKLELLFFCPRIPTYFTLKEVFTKNGNIFLKERADFKKFDIIEEMISHNEMELIALGKQLGKLLEKQDVIILSGDLGAGKRPLQRELQRG